MKLYAMPPFHKTLLALSLTLPRKQIKLHTHIQNIAASNCFDRENRYEGLLDQFLCVCVCVYLAVFIYYEFVFA